MENIIIQSNKDLEARLWLPEEAKKGIIIAHSFRNTFEQPICLEAAEEFYQKGYAVLAFNFIGHGNSKGNLRDLNLRTSSENVTSAINHLKEKDISKIGIYAISLGTIATVLSKEQPDSQFFISPSPLYNPKGLLERYKKFIDAQPKEIEEKGYAVITSGSGRGDFEMGKEWIDEMKEGKGEVKERYIQNKVPTLIVQGTEDELRRLNQVDEFIKSTNSEYFPVVGGDHEITNPEHRKIVINKAIDFFGRTL